MTTTNDFTCRPVPIGSFICTVLLVLSILQFDVFGAFGLAIYGLVIILGTVYFLYNFRNLSFFTGTFFWVAVAYYLFFLMASLANGSYKFIGPSICTLLLLTLAGFTNNSDEGIKNCLRRISKIYTVLGLLMSALSIAITLVAYASPSIIQKLSSELANEFLFVAGTFPTRMTGLAHQPNKTASFMCITASLSIYLLLSGPREKKWIISATGNIILGILTVFIFTASRTSMLSFLAFAGTIYVCYFLHLLLSKQNTKFKIHLFVLVTILVLVIAGLCFICAYTPARVFFLERVIRVSSLSDGSGRLSVYKEVFELGKQNRLIGIDVTTLAGQTTMQVPHSHNNMLEALTAGGIPTLVLYAIYFFGSLATSIRLTCKKIRQPMPESFLSIFFLAMIIGQFVQGLTEVNIDKSSNDIAFFVVLMAWTHVSFYNWKKEESRASSPSEEC